MTQKDFTLEQWANVMFKYESFFTERLVKDHLRVLWHNGCRLNSKHIVPSFKSGYQCVSVWVVSHCVDALHYLGQSALLTGIYISSN